MSVKKACVILFEDSVPVGQMICSTLKNWGFTVWWVVKIRQIFDHGVHCVGFDAHNQLPEHQLPEHQPPEQTPMSIEFEQMPVAFALLDGTLGQTSRPEDGPHGWDILPHLRRHGILCIAISNDEYTNQTMVSDFAELGAQFSTPHKQRRPDQFKTDLEGFLTKLGLMPTSANNT